MDDDYKTLGIDSNVSNEELRKKFLQLAKKYHPDKNLGKNEAFKILSTCYENIVSYRHHQETKYCPRNQNSCELNEDDAELIQISLNEDELVNGCRKSFTRSIHTPCYQCDSTGIHKHTHNVIICKNCKDWSDAYKEKVLCALCNGISKVILKDIKCKTCKGVGTFKSTTIDDIEIQKFIENDTKLRKGDCVIHITHKLEYIEKICNQTLFISIPITILDAFVGFTKEIQYGKENKLTVKTHKCLFDFEKTHDVVYHGIRFNISFHVAFENTKTLNKLSNGLQQINEHVNMQSNSYHNDSNSIYL
tara:strand:- start:131 stop:1045 length:915 start_codon:yes stop_codon:yes gene_type:complete